MLVSSLLRIQRNYESPYRKNKLSVFATISSGYDSTAVSCLVRDIGVRTCFTRGRSNSIVPSWLSKKFVEDDGGPIAELLGMHTIYLDDSNLGYTEDELSFYLASIAWPELAFAPMASYIEKTQETAVIFTGYHGDIVWGVDKPDKFLSDEILRGDMSGTNLSEIRLKSGFINVAVAFMYARSIRSIYRISRSPEMKSWRLNNTYDRPIPRRILESAGIDRRLFGMKKRAVVAYRRYPINLKLRERYCGYLRENYGLNPSYVYIDEVWLDLVVFLMKSIKVIVGLSPKLSKWKRILPKDLHKIGFQGGPFCGASRIKFNLLLFIWSNEILSAEMARILSKR